MKRIRIALVVVWLAGTACAWGAPGDLPGAGETSSGVYSIRLQWASGSPAAAGARLVCRARVAPALPGGQGPYAQPAAVVVGASAGNECTLEVPFSWAGHAAGGAVVEYEMDAVAADGTVLRRAGGKAVGVDVPPRGRTERVSIWVGM
ncbi:MAG TPA: hypothetical protein VG225_13095 [Terracidiphilus sp.]|jgi:hypothetical protein|nr:hypothetical protein [Terracidiphilus sp.]